VPTWATSKVSVTLEGNSLVDASTSALKTELQKVSPFRSKFTFNDYGVSGSTISMMASRSATTDASFVTGKTNFLILWEYTNNVHNAGRTGVQTIADMTAYIAARKAAKAWKVVLLTALPRGDFLGSFYTAAQGEVELSYCNTYTKANYLSMGADYCVDVRKAGGPFDFTDVTNANNFLSGYYMSNPNQQTHLNTAGQALISSYISAVLRKIRL